MKKVLFLILISQVIQNSCSQEIPILKIGLVADPQYANQPAHNKRLYRESLWKLEEAIDTFNYNKVDFVQNLGDIIDKSWESYDSILPIYAKLHADIENYQLLGNHDFSIDSTKLGALLEKLSMPHYYYAYSRKSWKFIVLDATDYSHYSNSLHHHDINQIDDYFKNTKEKSNHHLWNGAIGKEQQEWLKQELNSAQMMKQKVILFSHLPLRPFGDSHNLWNNEELVDIIEGNSNVVAFINGHNHAGNYIFKNGINYITLFGMVDTKMSSYSILEIYKDKIVLQGFGNQKTIILKT